MRGESKQQNNNTMYLLGQIPYDCFLLGTL